MMAMVIAFTFHLSPFTLSAQSDNDSAYWNNRFLQLLRWTYVDTSLSNLYLAPDTTEPIQEAALPLSTYQRIAWYGYTFQPSDQWPVVFNVAIGDGDPQTLTLPALEQLAQWGAFLTNQDYRRLVDEELRRMAEEMAGASDDTSYIVYHTSFIDSMEAVLMAERSLARENPEGALRQLMRCTDRDGDWYYTQGKVLMAMEQYDSAHQSFREAVRRSPENNVYRSGALAAAVAQREAETIHGKVKKIFRGFQRRPSGKK